MTKRSAEEKYTDPEQRERIEEEIKASDKSVEPGRCSGHESRILTRVYEKLGGHVGKDDSQKNLQGRVGEECQTREGETNARQGDGRKRYLPKQTWERMSDEDQLATEEEKREGSRQGAHRVNNTEKAKRARSKAQSPPTLERRGGAEEAAWFVPGGDPGGARLREAAQAPTAAVAGDQTPSARFRLN